MNIRLVVFALIFLVLGFTARAQQDSTVRFVRYGVFGSAGVNFHNAQFSSASDLVFTMNEPATYMYPFVINHDASATFGWSVGALVELPVWDVFGLSLRTSFSQIGNTFTAFDKKPIAVLSANGAMVSFRDVRFEYIADMTSLAQIGVEPYLTCRPVDMVVMYLGAQFATTINRRYRRFTSVADTNGISAIFRVDTVGKR